MSSVSASKNESSLLLPGKITAWKRLQLAEELDVLRSMNGVLWKAGRVITARCSSNLDESHHAPSDDCTCGIYALKSRQGAVEFWGSDWLAEIEIWGKVLEYEQGYKAEFATLVSAVLEPRQESKRYQTPISVYQDRRLSWFKYNHLLYDQVCAYCKTVLWAGTRVFRNGPQFLCVDCFTKRCAFEAYEVPRRSVVRGTEVLAWAKNLQYATSVKVVKGGLDG